MVAIIEWHSLVGGCICGLEITVWHSGDRPTDMQRVRILYGDPSTLVDQSDFSCNTSAIFHRLHSSYSSEMAKVRISKAIMVIYVVALFMVATNVSAQVEAPAPAPAPSMDTGAGFSLPVSSAVIAFSLIISFISLLKL
ncbi:hypothetical protein NC653_015738 [Populus alba x Populus x berolinensis]|uniref:Uncharacterized protein n=1 Tax=Populus alba x Populus x berolinensis TaxID=444605 RepID=A0AAD6QLA7_9ROSI|nr:hypothetical protein NC653_015738 [Populus alba x Populus x berolinensis]